MGGGFQNAGEKAGGFAINPRWMKPQIAVEVMVDGAHNSTGLSTGAEIVRSN